MNALLLLACLVAVASADNLSRAPSNGYNAPTNGYSYNGPPDLTDAGEEDPVAALAANIPGGGVPGEDYPILASVPETGFSCGDTEFPGYYADTADEAGCQVFHICQAGGRQDSFLCPNGTVFHQQYFVCNWWFNVDCSASEDFYELNQQIGLTDEDLADALRNADEMSSNLYRVPSMASLSPKYSAPGRV